MPDRVAADRHRASGTALLVVDMQNDFVRRGAPLEVADARATIAAHQRLIAAFRSRDLPVVFTRFLSYPDYYLLWEWSPQCRPDIRCCWKGHQRAYADIEGTRDGSAVIDEIAPAPGDLVIEKYGYGAFHGTDLAARLEAMGTGTLFVTGTVTQICVEETAREAFHEGFATHVVSDAVSSFAPHLHAAALENFAMKFGWVVDCDTVIARLG